MPSEQLITRLLLCVDDVIDAYRARFSTAAGDGLFGPFDSQIVDLEKAADDFEESLGE